MAVRLDSKDEAGAHGLAVEQDRAGAAVAPFAADLRAFDAELVPQDVEQEVVGLDLHRARLPVKLKVMRVSLIAAS